MVIWGEKENFVPRSHGETYAKLIPNCSELKVVPGAGHSVIVEKPDETAKLVCPIEGHNEMIEKAGLT